MRRILLICASAAILALPAAAGARGGTSAGTGYLVVRGAAGDGGVTGPPVVTAVVDGFVLGRISQEGRVAVYYLASTAEAATPQATGADLSRRGVSWHGLQGTEFSGSGFRFRAVGGVYRVVIRGAGIYVFAGGHGTVVLHGSASYPGSDGHYAVDGAAFRSLPSHPLNWRIGRG